ncbi:MAG: putative alpha/beta superfamily hydrolase [Sediminicola sp.]|jgi:predicted alpha/beta superfamily hydrolase
MKNIIISFLCIILFGLQTVFSQNNKEIIIGSKFIINSSILDEDRTYLISLPDSYNDSSEVRKKYPIMILLDGYTHFKTAAGIVHFMSSDRNRNYFIPETIIVAIENVDRERDFTVTKIKTKRPNTMGGGINFLNFIEKELIPYVDKNYRTEPSRILVGHSLGGLLALNSYMDKNSLFNAYISMDPSIWWDEELMIEKVNSIKPLSLKKKLYIATANQGEANHERNKKRHDAFFTLLNKKADGTIMVKSEYFENESHSSVPLIALYEGLKYLYNED